jgi:hypothetical protein
MIIFTKEIQFMRYILSLFSIALILSAHAENEPRKEAKSPDDIQYACLFDTLDFYFVDNYALYEDQWNQLAQPNFWKKVMTMSPDSCVINIAKTREIVAQFSVDDWNKFSDGEKDFYRDSIRKVNGLSSEDKVYMTTGKADFYAFDRVLPTIGKGVQVFKEENVDPWYAQAILMIESPGKLAKSNVGAYGPFQLMPSVARSHGLKVNKYVDERKDFVKSAQAASSLISNTCIPRAKEILDSNQITYEESDLWFRLFVLHVYHAGYGNVKAVVDAIKPTEGSSKLIKTMWQTSAGKFRNASQNYTQLALAALMIFDEIIEQEFLSKNRSKDQINDQG